MQQLAPTPSPPSRGPDLQYCKPGVRLSPGSSPHTRTPQGSKTLVWDLTRWFFTTTNLLYDTEFLPTQRPGYGYVSLGLPHGVRIHIDLQVDSVHVRCVSTNSCLPAYG